MKKTYESPTAELIEFVYAEQVTASDGSGTTGGGPIGGGGIFEEEEEE